MPRSPKQRRTALLKGFFGLALFVTLVVWGKIDLAILGNLLATKNLTKIAYLVLLQLGVIVTMALRWHLLVTSLVKDCSWSESLLIHLRGSALGLALPGVGIDIARIAWANQHTDEPAVTSSPALTDRVIGAATLVTAASAGFLYLQFVSQAFLLIGALAVLILIGGAFAFKGFHSRLVKSATLHKVLEALRTQIRHPGRLVNVVLLALVGHTLLCIITWESLRMLGQTAPVIPFLAAFSVVQFFQSLPITPMGIGIGEGAATMIFPKAGLEFAAESIILARAVRIVAGLLLLPFALFWSPTKTKSETVSGHSAD